MLKQFMNLVDDMGSMKVKTSDGGWTMPDDVGSDTEIFGESLYELFFNRMAHEVRLFVESIDGEDEDITRSELKEYLEYYIDAKRKLHTEAGM